MSIQNEEVAAVAAAATAAWKQYERALESIYVELQTADAELATALAETFGDGSRGMQWLLARPVIGQESYCALRAAWKREVVLQTLGRIRYGVYS